MTNSAKPVPGVWMLACNQSLFAHAISLVLIVSSNLSLSLRQTDPAVAADMGPRPGRSPPERDAPQIDIDSRRFSFVPVPVKLNKRSAHKNCSQKAVFEGLCLELRWIASFFERD